MKQRYVIDLSMRYMGEFESEVKARHAALFCLAHLIATIGEDLIKIYRNRK